MIDSMFSFIIVKKLESANDQKERNVMSCLKAFYTYCILKITLLRSNSNKHRMQNSERVTNVFMTIIDENFNVHDNARTEKHMLKFSRVSWHCENCNFRCDHLNRALWMLDNDSCRWSTTEMLITTRMLCFDYQRVEWMRDILRKLHSRTETIDMLARRNLYNNEFLNYTTEWI